MESEVFTLEGRIFYNYPGQSSPPVSIGMLGFPSTIGRVVKDASGNNQTQATKYQYNAKANVAKVTDPVGRETVFDYDTNGIDVVAVKQKTDASTWTTMISLTYGGGAPDHRPASVTDGAGNTTTYTYASTGQVLTITNAKSEVTSFTYETNLIAAAYGRLLSITGDVPGGNRSFTYDTYGRVLTSTDSEGYVLTYDYDSLDRVRTITYPDGSFEQLEYEDHSLVATKDREGRWTRHQYNPLMERVVTQDPELRMTQYQVPVRRAPTFRGREREYHGVAARRGQPCHEEDLPRRGLRNVHVRLLWASALGSGPDGAHGDVPVRHRRSGHEEGL